MLQNKFEKFDLYPFIVLAVDEGGTIIYKNYLASKLFDKIRVGAKLSNYTKINLVCGIKNSTLCESAQLFMVTKADDVFVISVFPPCDFLENREQTDELISKIINQGESDDKNASLKKKYLNRIIKSYSKAEAFSHFTNLYIKNNSDNESELDVLDVCTSVTGIASIINNRFEEKPISINLDLQSSPIGYRGNKRAFLALILNLILFCILTSCDEKATISLRTQENDAVLSFIFKSNAALDTLYEKESMSVIIPSVLLCIDSTDEIKYSFEKDGNDYVFGIRFTPCRTDDFVLSSKDKTSCGFDEYLDTLLLILKTF